MAHLPGSGSRHELRQEGHEDAVASEVSNWRLLKAAEHQRVLDVFAGRSAEHSIL